MNKLKICVYAISKNEEEFVQRWMNSVSEADEVFVLDTGSTNNTVDKLKKLNAKVTSKEIKPWRFDVARNESLKLVPDDYDICVCMDLDEVISKGWRQKLESLWKNGVNHLRYNYNWSHDEKGNPKVIFYIEKIHARHNFKWTHPVHEVLEYTVNKEVWKTTDEITVDHYPDNAPQESYFGHMKDELNLFTFRDICNEIKDYIEYYNNYRYQWNLKKMTPVQYRNHLFASIA